MGLEEEQWTENPEWWITLSILPLTPTETILTWCLALLSVSLKLVSPSGPQFLHF